LAFATFLVWQLRIGACGVGACAFIVAPMTATQDRAGEEHDFVIFEFL